MTGAHVVVIGAGAVGLGAALFLLEEGVEVTLVDRAEPGQQTSAGNAGVLSEQSVTAINSPEVLKSLPRLLTSRRSPLRIRWRDLPWTAAWLVAFARHCRAEPAARSSRAQAALAKASGDAWRVLLQRHGGHERVQWTGWLKLAEDAGEAAGLAREHRRVLEEGHDAAWLDGDEVAALEPGLGPRFAGGLWLKTNGQVDRPGELLRHLATRFVDGGGRLVTDEVRDIQATAAGVAVVTTGQRLEADQAVLATGPWSAPLARRLGCVIPLVAERGYHLMLPQPRMPLGRAILSVRGGFVLAPMGDSLRLTSGAEIARLGSSPDEGPVRALLDDVRRLLPDAVTEVASSWVGARPSTPDSLPIIDRAPKLDRVVLAYGHGHVGLTMGPITGRLVADLVLRREPRLPLAAYAATR